MMTLPVAPVGLEPLTAVSPAAPAGSPGPGGVSFTRMVMDGLGEADDRLREADRLTRAFALGEDIPVHQVTFALEQARLSFELVSQVRSRLVESYQELLRMQV